MIRIACVLKAGGDYVPEHVHALRDGCARHMPPHEFVCYTDIDLTGIPNCRAVSLQHPEWRGWWSKMEIFGPALDDVPTLYFDLDTVLIGPCHEILQAAEGRPFVILRDVYRGKSNNLAVQSSVMYWHSRPSGVHDAFLKDAAGIMGRLRSDQEFLEQFIFSNEGIALIQNVAFWQDLGPGFASFKADVRCRGVLPKDRIIVFHGRPRPWEQILLPYVGGHVRTDLVLRKGWVVPGSDVTCLPIILAGVLDLDSMVLRCARRRTAIQAGGNVGVWPARLAKKFNRCITFEPDALNFAALKINTGDLRNIQAYHAALGAHEGQIGLHRCPENVGAHYLHPGDEVRLTTVDALGITDCDLLQLDVEGSEHDALLGAQETIRRTHPVVVLELKGFGKRYGHSNEQTTGLLKSWGYEEVERRNRDVIFQHPHAIDRGDTQLDSMSLHPPVTGSEALNSTAGTTPEVVAPPAGNADHPPLTV